MRSTDWGKDSRDCWSNGLSLSINDLIDTYMRYFLTRKTPEQLDRHRQDRQSTSRTSSNLEVGRCTHTAASLRNASAETTDEDEKEMFQMISQSPLMVSHVL